MKETPLDKVNLGFLQTLEDVISERLRSGDDSSYTARLAAEGTVRIAQKVGEEGVELALAGAAGEPEQVTGEAADLLYHVLVLLRQRGLSLGHVVAELESRHRA